MPFGFPLQTNEKGQVVTKTALLKQMEELIEEPGLTCCICREGYKFQVCAQPEPDAQPGRLLRWRPLLQAFPFFYGLMSGHVSGLAVLSKGRKADCSEH